jgi:spermidine synthase/Flp pilus assembly protein TadD
MRVPNLNGMGTFRIIDIDATNVAGTNPELIATQKLQAHMPLILHGNPKSALHIGFGSGGTCYSASSHNMPGLDAVELSQEVLQSAYMFPDTNHGVLSNPKLHVYVDDARSYLEGTSKRYDAILSDSIHPQILGNSWLYSEDYFRLCKSRLNQGGVISFWLPIYSLSTDDLKLILRTFQKVFPNVYLWYPNSVCSPFTIAMAFNGPKTIDKQAIERGMSVPAIRDDLAEINVNSADDIMSFLLLGPDEIRDLCGDGPTNTDDLPVLELSSPRAYDRNGTWARNFAMLIDSGSKRTSPQVKLLLCGHMNQLVYRSGYVFRCYEAAGRGAINDYAERQAEKYAFEADDAADTLVQLVNENANGPWYRPILARLAMKDGDCETAVSLLEPVAGKLDPRSRVLLAAAYSMTGNEAKAKKVLNQTEPKTAEVLAALAGIAGREGQTAKSVRMFGQALSLDPRRDAIRKDYISALLMSGQMNRAADEYAVLVKRRPADPNLLTAYASLLDRLGRHDEARKQLEAAKLFGK